MPDVDMPSSQACIQSLQICKCSLRMPTCALQIHGTRNATNIVKAMILAFESQTTPREALQQKQMQAMAETPPLSQHSLLLKTLMQAHADAGSSL